MLLDDPPDAGNQASAELDLANERIRGLEQLVEHLHEQVTFEQSRYAELYADIKSGALALPAPRSRRWWRFWG